MVYSLPYRSCSHYYDGNWLILISEVKTIFIIMVLTPAESLVFGEWALNADWRAWAKSRKGSLMYCRWDAHMHDSHIMNPAKACVSFGTYTRVNGQEIFKKSSQILLSKNKKEGISPLNSPFSIIWGSSIVKTMHGPDTNRDNQWNDDGGVNAHGAKHTLHTTVPDDGACSQMQTHWVQNHQC